MIRPLLKPDREPVLDLLRAASNFTESEHAIAIELIDVVLGQPGYERARFIASSNTTSSPVPPTTTGCATT